MQPRNTLFIGKVLKRFPNLGSTNSFAQELLAKTKPAEGTVIMTDNQTSGRGQIGRKWVSSPGQNLTLSLILYPSFLPLRQHFALNKAVALAVCQFLAEQLQAPISIKWPNDIYYERQKVCGILIQNSINSSGIQSSIVGLGINVNQQQFDPSLPNPTSMARIAGRTFELDALLPYLFHWLEVYYLQLRQKRYGQLDDDYQQQLYGLGKPMFFKDQKEEIFAAEILGVTNTGKLLVQRAGYTDTFDLNQITFTHQDAS